MNKYLRRRPAASRAKRAPPQRASQARRRALGLPITIASSIAGETAPSRPQMYPPSAARAKRAAAARRFKEKSTMTKTASDSPVWLVTGCSTGLGREFARAALAHGFRVVATARDPKSIADLVKGKEGQAIALKLDVADPEGDRRRGQGGRARLRPHRRADQQRRLRLHERGRGGRGRGDPRPVRDQFLRPRGDDPRRPAGHAQAPPRRDRQHLLGRRPARRGRPAAITARPSTR